MILESHPATAPLHKHWEDLIKSEFVTIDFSDSSDYLSIIQYLDSTPQKFYLKEAFLKYYQFLIQSRNEDPELLASILTLSESLLSLSNKILTEVNNQPIHDTILPKDQNELIDFIDKEIHFNLLKVYETPLFQFSYIISKWYWTKANKGTSALDLYNSIQQLKTIGFEFVDRYYLHNVRNGIAHGKIIFTDSDIAYIDKKGNKEQIRIRKIIEVFDGILDIVNGFALALKVFYSTNRNFIEKHHIPIPQSLLIEELQYKCNGAGWSITNCLESMAMMDKSQLLIYVKNSNWDYNKVLWHAFSTAYWSERLTKSYNRIFLHLHSKNGKLSPVGWASFNADKLKTIRESGKTDIAEYTGVLEGDLLFFDPKFRFPNWVYKLGTFLSIIRYTLPLAWKNYLNTYFTDPFIVRETRIHSKGRFSVLQDPSIIIKPNFNGDIQELIIKNHKKIVAKAVRYTRKQCGWFTKEKYLPIKHIRIFIYDSDKRVRQLRNSGLIPELIATISVNTTKRIPTIDIINGEPQQFGKYRIVWYKRWQGRSNTLNDALIDDHHL
jgi:hypothetical protein